MKHHKMKWISVTILFITCVVVVGLNQLQGFSPEVELKPVKYGTIAVNDVRIMNPELERPMGVAVQKDLVAVADAALREVTIHAVNNKGSFTIKTGGQGKLSYPVDAAFGNGGKLYVADMYQGAVYYYGDKGKYLGTLAADPAGAGPGAYIPTAISVDTKGNLYITDVGKHRILVFNAKGKFLFDFGQAGSAAGQLLYPNGIVVDEKKELIIVSEANNSRLQIFDLKGKYQRPLNLPGNLKLSSPRGMALTADREVLVTNTLGNQLLKVDPFSGSTEVLALKGGMLFPNDVAFGDNRVYVADRGNKRLISFTIKASEVKGLEEN